MKKFLKIFAIAAIAVAAAIACVFAGCGGGDDGDSGSADYNFTIVYVGGDKDGQPVNGQTDGHLAGGKVLAQICLPGANGTCVGLNLSGIYPTADGKVSLSQSKVNELFGSSEDVTVFTFHVISVTGYKNDCEVAVNGKGNYPVSVTVS